MTDRTCPKCGKSFTYPAYLKSHLQRKNPCTPIVAVEDLPAGDKQKPHPCKYCGRRFASQLSAYRHMRQNCKIANSAEVPIQQQMASLHAEQTAKVDMLQVQVAELAILLKGLILPGLPPAQPSSELSPEPPSGSDNREGAVNQVIATSVTNVGRMKNVVQQNIQQNLVIVPWDGDKRISIDVSQIAAAFAESAPLREYSLMSDYQLADPKLASPYVTELLVELIRRGHADPAARNVYLNPNRADQALVRMKSGLWDALTVTTATQALLSGVAASIHEITLSSEKRRMLSSEVQNALAMADMLYSSDPEEFARRAKPALVAHLANLANLANLAPSKSAAAGQKRK